MKLVHVDLEKPIAIHRNCPTEWIIESPELFLKYVEQLQKQNQGEEGNFVLSKADTELNMKRDVELILTPFSLDFADHRIQKQLFTELVKSAQNEEMFLETQRIIAELKKYIYQLEAASGYELEQNEEIDLSALLKLMGVQTETEKEMGLLEKLTQYIKVMAELLQKELVILINIRSYLNETQINKLSQMACYYEISLLFIENIQRDFSNQREYYIIDKDGCDVY